MTTRGRWRHAVRGHVVRRRLPWRRRRCAVCGRLADWKRTTANAVECTRWTRRSTDFAGSYPSLLVHQLQHCRRPQQHQQPGTRVTSSPRGWPRSRRCARLTTTSSYWQTRCEPSMSTHQRTAPCWRVPTTNRSSSRPRGLRAATATRITHPPSSTTAIQHHSNNASPAVYMTINNIINSVQFTRTSLYPAFIRTAAAILKPTSTELRQFYILNILVSIATSHTQRRFRHSCFKRCNWKYINNTLKPANFCTNKNFKTSII